MLTCNGISVLVQKELETRFEHLVPYIFVLISGFCEFNSFVWGVGVHAVQGEFNTVSAFELELASVALESKM